MCTHAAGRTRRRWLTGSNRSMWPLMYFMPLLAQGHEEAAGPWAAHLSSGTHCRVLPSHLGVMLPKHPGLGQACPVVLSVTTIVHLPAQAQLRGWKGITGEDEGWEKGCLAGQLRLIAYAFGRCLPTQAVEQGEHLIEEQETCPSKHSQEPLAERLYRVRPWSR